MASRRFTIHTCSICGKKEFEDNMLEYNDHYFCGLPHQLIQKGIDDENLNRPKPCLAIVVPFKPGPGRATPKAK